jgi:transmembrane sensor
MSAARNSEARLVEERAAGWLLRREEPDWSPGDQAALDAWLDESLAHKAAYWRLEHGWRQADRIGALGELPRLQARAGWLGRYWRPIAIAASLLLTIGLGATYLISNVIVRDGLEATATQSYATPVGGRRLISLPDGSRVELNTATIVRSGVTPESREFWLDRGEAYFEVAHAADHPFVVHAGPRTITVLGTKFSVRRDGNRVSVSVVEGRVRVDQAGDATQGGGQAAPSTTITGGDVALADGASTLVTANAADRVEHALSWRRGMLTFDQTTLGDAAAEFNRYNRQQIIIADPGAAGIRIGGTFQAANVDAFARLLREAYGLRVEVRNGQTRISG